MNDIKKEPKFQPRDVKPNFQPKDKKPEIQPRGEKPTFQPMDEIPNYKPEKYIAEHTVGGGETLSHIALKYYGSAVKEKWMIIYEANKAVIGENPNIIRSGQVLKIPELSE